MNVSELRDYSLQLINQYSAEGQTLAASDTVDFKLAFLNNLNTAQNTFSKKDKIQAIHLISQYPVASLLGDNYDIVQHLDEDIVFSTTGAKSYTFEVNHPAMVYVEEETATDIWTVLSTLTLTPTAFTKYTGLIMASSVDNTVRLRFSGSYIYSIRRIALYAYSFATVADIPQYNPGWNEYTLPSDHIEINQIEYNEKPLIDYSIRNKVLFIKNDLVGAINVHYYKRPTKLVNDSDEPEISEQNHEYLAFYPAGQWLKSHGKQADGIALVNEFFGYVAEARGNTDQTSSGFINAISW